MVFFFQGWFLCSKKWDLIHNWKSTSSRETKPNSSSICLWIREQEHYQSFAICCQPFWSCGFFHWNIPSYLLETEHPQKKCRFGYVYSHCKCDIWYWRLHVVMFLDSVLTLKPGHAKLILILCTGCVSVTPPPTVSTPLFTTTVVPASCTEPSSPQGEH